MSDTAINISIRFESVQYRYDQLVERDFLDSLWLHLYRELGSRMDEYEFIVCSSNGEQNTPTSLGVTGTKPRVLIDSSDESASVPFELARNFVATFKVHLPREYPEHKIFAFPLGCVRGVPRLSIVPVNERKYNVFFSGCLQRSRHQLYLSLARLARRSRGIQHTTVSELADDYGQESGHDLSDAFPRSFIQFTPGFLGGLDRSSYGTMLQESKIALYPGGWRRNETFRHFEAMRAGCVLVSVPLPQTRLYHDSPIVFVEGWHKLKRTVCVLLQDPARLMELQKLTVGWWENVCSERATAAYIAAQLVEPRSSS